jgi:phospholipid/cholesterol/gamma-HCH transport system substrate-binding protein
MSRRGGGRFTPFQAGLLTAVTILVAVYLATSKDIPFTTPFELKAVFANAQNIGRDSPVRIAGVEVGKVSKVEPAEGNSEATAVTMKLTDDARPIFKDARLRIRPRIFLEGNFFVDLEPGTPGAPEVHDGDTIPISQTSASVQLDQVLAVLKLDTRDSLQRLLEGYGRALVGRPGPGEDADQDPDVRGKTAAQSLNRALAYSPDALRGTAIVNEALLGTRRRDLSKLVAGLERVSSALIGHEEQLKDLITNLDVTTGALASRQESLRQTVALLPRVLEAAGPALDNLNRSFPPTRAFAREILPGLRELPAAIDASFPWIAQTKQLVSPAELGGLVDDLQPAVSDLAATIAIAPELLSQLDLVDRCALRVVLPTANTVIDDPPFSTGLESYKEFFLSLVGLTGESQNFDGNGPYTRFQPGGGANTVATGALPGTGPWFANAIFAPLGTRPAKPAARPPYNHSFPCHRNTPPDLNSARTGGGP